MKIIKNKMKNVTNEAHGARSKEEANNNFNLSRNFEFFFFFSKIIKSNDNIRNNGDVDK